MSDEIAKAMASTNAPRVRASAFLTMFFIFEKASLPLSVLSRHISWMTPKGPRMARECLPVEMALEE